MSHWTNVSFIGVGAKAAGSGGNLTLNAPSSPTVNDVWIAVVHSSDNNAHTFSGWTQIVQGNGGGTDSRLSVWYHRYAGSTPNLIVGHTSSGDTIIGGIASFGNVKPGSSPVHVNSSISTGTDSSIEHTGVTISQRGCTLLAINGAADDNDRTALGGRWISAFDEAGTQNYESTAGTVDGSIALSYDLDATIAATGTVTQTQVASDQWAAVLIALEPKIDPVPFFANLSLSSSAPTVDLTAEDDTYATVSVALLTAEPFEITDFTISPAQGNLVLSAVAPTVVQNILRTPAQADLALSTFAPTATTTDHRTITPAQADLTLSAVAPSVSIGFVRQPAQGDLVLSTFAPTAVQDVARTPAQGDLTFSTFAPTATQNVARTPAQADLTLSTNAPLVAVSIQPAQADLTLSSVAPSVATGINIAPAQADLTLTGVAPTVTQDTARAPAQADLTFSTFAPGVRLSVMPAAADLSLSGFAPTVETTAHVTIAPSQGSLTFFGATPVVVLNSYIHPDADISDGTWTDQDGGTDLFEAVNEVQPANDTDYIKSGANPVNDTCVLGFSDPDDVLLQPFDVMYRYKKTGTGTIDLTVRLLELTTEIATWSHTDISDEFADAVQTLTNDQFLAITDTNNLRIEFKANLSA